MPLPLTLNTPGRWGVNEQEENQLLHPNWATVADGLVINDAGQLQCRGALDLISTDGAPAEILRQFVYVTAAGTETVISSTATKIIAGTGDLDDASTDITPTGAPTDGFWQFQNFNGKVVAWQRGHTPIVWSGSGDFAVITASSGTLPDGDCVLAAYGRLWAVDDDGQTIRYCALLDETLWAVADGGGSIDMRNVWPKGMDRVNAIAAFGGTLVIFGRRSIVIYTDGSGSALGVDPAQMYVVDTIDGTGCAARDSVKVVGEGDLLFLSEVGLQSLGRVIANKDNPLDTISWQIGDRLSAAVAAEIESAFDHDVWTGHYIPQTGQYMLVDTANEDVYVFHIGGRTQDEKGRLVVPITIWDTSILTNIRGFITTRSGITYTTGSATHELYKYDTSLSTDEGGVAIPVIFDSGWLAIEDPEFAQVNKMLKMAQLTILNPAGIDSRQVLRYAADYSTDIDTLSPAFTSDESRVVALYDPSGDIEGQYFKLGFSDTSFGRKVLTQLQAQFKPGRTAFIHKKFADTATETYEAASSGYVTNPYAQVQTVSFGAAATTFDLSLADIPEAARAADSALIVFALVDVISAGNSIPTALSTPTSGGSDTFSVGTNAQTLELAADVLSRGWVCYAVMGAALAFGDVLRVTLSSSFGTAGTVRAVVYGIAPPSSALFYAEKSALTTLSVDDTPSKANANATTGISFLAVAGGRNDYDADTVLTLLQPAEFDALAVIPGDGAGGVTMGMLCAIKFGLPASAIAALTGEVRMTNTGAGKGQVAIIYGEEI